MGSLTLEQEYRNLMRETRKELARLNYFAPISMKESYASTFLRQHRILEDLVSYSTSRPPCGVSTSEAAEIMDKWCKDGRPQTEWSAHPSIRATITRNYAAAFHRISRRMHRLERRLADYNAETQARLLEADYLLWKIEGSVQ